MEHMRDATHIASPCRLDLPRRASAGDVIGVSRNEGWSEGRWSIRLTMSPAERAIRHGNIASSTFCSRRDKLVEAQVIVGEVVFDHAVPLAPKRDWRTYSPLEHRDPIPVVAIHDPQDCCAWMWMGDPGQPLQRVLDAAGQACPKVLSPRERMRSLAAPIAVLLVSDDDRRGRSMAEFLTAGSTFDITHARTAGYARRRAAEATIAIVREQVRERSGAPATRETALALVRELSGGLPVIGWASGAGAHRREDGSSAEDALSGAGCAGIYTGGVPSRHLVQLVLDAVGAPAADDRLEGSDFTRT